MGASQSGLQTPSGVVTGSGYLVRDVLCSAFQIPYAAGVNGAVLFNSRLIDGGSANNTIRLHLYAAQPSAKVIGDPWSLADSDEVNYCGFIDHSTWYSAGTSKMISQITNPGMGVWSSGRQRHIWGELESRFSGAFGDSANPLRYGAFFVRDRDK